MDIIDVANDKIVVFVEINELERIEAYGTDAAIHDVKTQIRELYEQGHEIALHLHPQWCNAHYSQGAWELDYDEYNLCILQKIRIADIVGSAINYLRTVLASPDFTPLSFRAGNWLFQPTQSAAEVLVDHGIKIDSSVFKGGRQHQNGLDYRRALKNGYFWKFSDDVNTPVPNGIMLEIPIYTRMVPFWQMATGKRVGLHKKGSSSNWSDNQRLQRLWDMARFQYPLKLDFCRMTLNELTSMMNEVIREDKQDPKTVRPIVAIGHTKDLVDFSTIKSFLTYLRHRNIPVSTLEGVYRRHNL